MAAYVQWSKATKLLKHFSITRILRSENWQVDALSKLASSFEDGKSKDTQQETLTELLSQELGIVVIYENTIISAFY